MDNQAAGILVMLNNYFHDFAVAVLICSLLMSYFLSNEASKHAASLPIDSLVAAALRRFAVVTKVSFGWVMVGGVIRMLTYRDFEWVAAAGNGQVLALGVKHVILVSLIVVSFWLTRRERRRLQYHEARG